MGSINVSQFSSPSVSLGNQVLCGDISRGKALRECNKKIRMFKRSNPEASENWKEIKAFYKEMFRGNKENVNKRLNADGVERYDPYQNKPVSSFTFRDLGDMDINDGKNDDIINY